MALTATRWLLLAAVMAALASGALLKGMPHAPGPMLAGIFAGLAIGLLFAVVLRRLLPDACDTAPPVLRKRYTREMMVALGGYVVLLFSSIGLLKHVDSIGLRALVALLPVPPIALMLRAMIRYIRDADELQQRIELQAVSFATALVSLLYLGGGLLQVARVVDVPAGAAMIWVFPLLCLGYGLVKAVVARRYR
ncbi:hypothetical protein ARC78_03150 [Stenotrophomonas pictorum JCM 9942]|uniref:Transmembrane protein n=2 Tax=Stenotrophomonas pictorum TaxID=86184 RepID=A0A0R0AJB1_9GAMM|nr:hypothetical protein [Stenotrophomonas pictorum]KRG45197.1 hypothetical protein ARC78_03150 [Stenotrophomonas pictorum JCM 9942]